MVDPLPISISADFVEASEVRDADGDLVAPRLRGKARLIVVDLQPAANFVHWMLYLFIFEQWGESGGRRTPTVWAQTHLGWPPAEDILMVPMRLALMGLSVSNGKLSDATIARIRQFCAEHGMETKPDVR